MTVDYNAIGNFKDVQAFGIELNRWLQYDVTGRLEVAVIALNGEAYCINHTKGSVGVYSANNKYIYAYFSKRLQFTFNQTIEFELPVAQILFQQGMLQDMGGGGNENVEIFSGVGGLNHLLWCDMPVGTRYYYELARQYQDKLFTNERGG